MGRLIVLDLMGTLLDGNCVTNPKESIEYPSRIMALGRMLNTLLDNKKENINRKEIIILTDYSHSTIENMKKVLNDIYNSVSDINKDRIRFMVAGINKEDESKEMMFPNSNNRVVIDKKLELFINKDEAYKQIIDRYRGYSIIAVDDNPSNNDGFTYLNKQEQKTCYIISGYDSNSFTPEGFSDSKSTNYAWIDPYEMFLEQIYPYVDFYEINEKAIDQIEREVFNRTYEEYRRSFFGEELYNSEYYEEELHNFIKKVECVQHRKDDELWNKFKELKEQYFDSFCEEEDVLSIFVKLYVDGMIDAYDLFVATRVLNKNVYKDVSLEEILAGYNDGKIIASKSIRDSYERVLKPFFK